MRTSDPRPRWTARQVIVAVLVGLGVGSLFNAETLLATAERQPFGWQRDAAVAVASPLADTSRALRLDRPRHLIDVALGRDGPAGGTDAGDADDPPLLATDGTIDVPAGVPPTPVADLPPADPAADPPAAHEPASPAEARGPVTPGDPLTMYIGGDSMVGQFGMAMDNLGNATGLISTTEVVYEFGSGLSRPDFVDWPARLADVSEEQDPDVMVLYFGGNDAQALELDGVVYEPEAEEWQAEYRSRVVALMDQLDAAGHHVYWMGMPVPRSETMVQRLSTLNDIYESEAAERDAITFVASWDLFAGPDGTYSEYLEDDDGNLVDMRLDDGIHLTTAGAYRLARVTIARIAEDYDLEMADRED